MKRNQKSVSQAGLTQPEFEFHPTISNELSNDVVFCGKVITRKTEPGQAKRDTAIVAGKRSASGKESRYRRSGSERKSYTFGTAVKFPLQMELSDIKMRQVRREPTPLPKFITSAEENGGGESCWEIVRPLRRWTVMSALKASFGCIRAV